jgi:glycosyltransferase involved in cell wall biosynthesis
MEKDIILSIIVPTRNRYNTLLPLLECLLKWPHSDFEVVIQDNSDDTTPFLEWMQGKDADVRLQYQHTKGALSAPENCDLAFSKAKGRYVCFIGDDDGVTQQLIDCCRQLEQQKIDAAIVNKAVYIWPDTKYKYYGDKFSGLLTIKKFKGTMLALDAADEMVKVLKGGAQDMGNLPKSYHGIVARRVLQQLYALTGTYFPGPVPDMSNSVGLVPFVRSFVYWDLPVIISGTSAQSMAGRSAQKQHIGRIETESSLPKDTVKKWSSHVPLFWSGPTIWAEAAVKALSATGRQEDMRHFNFPKLYAACFTYGYQFKKEIWNAIRSSGFNNPWGLLKIAYYYTELLALRGFYFLKLTLMKQDTGAALQTSGVSDIGAAISIVENQIETSNK